ncbi:aspartate/glutamate racemase family protein [Anaerocolumna sp. AGMB13025]|uniref:aspartate/glutamate racemase family protein n=1 Tax=Anaerocolumna sp. AGMB13025 TaxID=3039116 RepID=UPI00241F399F|nr:aspartate/glutamate racemase family protein [Anaerocolumna sp. AGMB13025]WFR58718.1 aspartate/glutamate racemase family protein [Anaerocolumna sp. AGMB13025]
MKTIGLIGGMSWESTVTYYQIINKTIKEQLGGFHSAKCILYSVDFHEIEALQTAGEWEKSGDIMVQAALSLERAGADFIVICTNTMHKVVGQMEKEIHIPVLHIAEATAEVLISNRINKAALLGTKYTMEQDFYKSRLTAKGIEVVIPDSQGIEFVNNTIYKELCLGILSESSRTKLLNLIDSIAAQGAQGVILGCTEIGLLIHQKDTKVPLFDTTLIHAQKAARNSIGI